MLHPVKEIKIVNTDQQETFFRIKGRAIVPFPNFKLAQLWYSAQKLTPECKMKMEWILKNRLYYFS